MDPRTVQPEEPAKASLTSEKTHVLETIARRAFRRVRSAIDTLLRAYAECFFSSSRASGVLLLAATALSPYSGLLGVLAVACAIATARLLGVVSTAAPASAYAYSAMFIGLGASSTFVRPAASLGLAALGGAASAVITAGMRGLMQPVGLQPLSLPFVLVYLCSVSAGGLLKCGWAVGTSAVMPAWLWFLPEPVRSFFEALGAILFIPRADAGLLVFVALCTNRWQAPLFAWIGYMIAYLFGRGLFLPPAIRSAAEFNAIFASLGLGLAWSSPGRAAWIRAATGGFLCVAFTIALADPLGRLWLVPVSLPFNFSVLAIMLMDRQRASARSGFNDNSIAVWRSQPAAER